MAIKKALRAKLIAGVVIFILIIILTVLLVCVTDGGNRCSSIDPFRSNNWSSSDNSEYNFAANLVLFAKDYYQTKIATIVVLTLLSLIVFAILGFVVYLFVLQRKRQIEITSLTSKLSELKEDPTSEEDKQ